MDDLQQTFKEQMYSLNESVKNKEEALEKLTQDLAAAEKASAAKDTASAAVNAKLGMIL